LSNRILDINKGTEVGLSSDHLPVVTSKDVKLSEELFESYRASNSTWRDQAYKDILFVNNAQWSKADAQVLKDRNQNPMVDNVIRPARDQAIAMLTTNAPRFQATSMEDSDRKTGKFFSDILSYIWQNSNGNMELKCAISDYFDTGLGGMMTWSDPKADWGKGEIYLRSISSLDTYIDPNTRNKFALDAAHIILSFIVSGEQLQSVYGVPLAKIKQMTQDFSDGAEGDRERTEDQEVGIEGGDDTHMTFRIIDRYTKVKVKFIHVINEYTPEERDFNEEQFKDYLAQKAFILYSIDGKEEVVTNPAHLIEVQKMYTQTGGIFHQMMDEQTGQPTIMPGEEHEGSIPGSTVVMREITLMDLYQEGKIVASETNEFRIKRVFSAGGVECWNRIEDISDYPFAIMLNGYNRNTRPLSDVRIARPLQEFINKQEAQIAAHTANSTNVKVFVPQGSVNIPEMAANWGKAGAQYFEFNPELGAIPVIVQVPALSNSIYANIESAKTSIYHIFGIHPLQYGDPGSAPDTFKGTVAIDEYSQRRIRSKLDDIEGALNHLCKIIVEMVQKTYGERKIIRLIKPNNISKSIVLNEPLYDDITGDFLGRMNDVSMGKYDMICVSGSTLPSNRWARFEYYDSLAQKGYIDQEEVLKQTEVVDIEGVLERSSIMKQMQEYIGQLEEELKNTKGDLQTATRESLHDKKRLEVEKFKTGLNEVTSKAQASAKLFDARLKDNLAMARQSQNDGEKA
jgi:hypothetical protein